MKNKYLLMLLVFLCFGNMGFSQNKENTKADTAVTTAKELKDETSLTFTYGYISPYVMNDSKTDISVQSIGFTVNYVNRLHEYFGIFHSISNKFYGDFLGENQFRTTVNRNSEFFWDLSYTVGLRTYLFNNLFFLDAGLQVALRMDSEENKSLSYGNYAFHTVFGAGINIDIKNNKSVQIAAHYIVPLIDKYSFINNTGLILDIGMSWSI